MRRAGGIYDRTIAAVDDQLANQEMAHHLTAESPALHSDDRTKCHCLTRAIERLWRSLPVHSIL